MTDVIGTLRNAGYSEEDIGNYMTGQRNTLKAGGYNDDEIDAYLGIPRTPQNIPGPLIQRAVAGNEAVKTLNELPSEGGQVTGWLEKLWKRGEPQPGTFGEKVAETEGDAMSSAFDVAKAAGRGWVIGAGDKPLGSWTGPPDWNKPGWEKLSQVGLTLVGSPLEGVVRLGGGVLGAVTGAGMEAMKKITGKDYGPEDVAGFLNDYLPGLIGVHTELARIDRDPVRTPEVTKIGKLPDGPAIQDAAAAIGHGETTPLMEKKLTGLYVQQGLHPAEVADAALKDPVIAQSILSADAGDMPYGYQFHGYEALPETTAAAERTAAEQRGLGLQASVREPYFQDVPRRGRPFKTDYPLNIDQPEGSIPETGMPVADGFELKPEQQKQDLREQLLLESKPVEHSAAVNWVLSKISIGKAAIERPWTLGRFYTDFFDKLFPIQQEVAARDLPNLTTENNPYQLARLMAGWVGKADHFINNGTFDFGTYANNGKSLKEILEPIKEDLDGFRAYAAASRALELEGRGIESGLKREVVPGTNMTGFEDATETVRSGFSQYERPFRELVDYQNRVTAYLRDSGVLSAEAYKAMTEANRMYVPFTRVMGIDGDASARGGSTLQAHNPINKIKGSARDIVDPLESVIRNTYNIVEMAERNQVGLKLADLLNGSPRLKGKPVVMYKVGNPDLPRAGAMADALGEVGIKGDELAEALANGSQKDTPGTISVMRDGKRETYKVDQELAIAMKGLDVDSVGIFARLFGVPAETLRAGATLTPEFWTRHVVRDFLYAVTTFKKGVFNPMDMARGIAGMWVKDADYWDWLKGGGGNISSVGIDRRYLQENLAKLTEQTGLMGRAWNVLANPQASMWDKASTAGALPFQAISKYVLDPLRVGVELAENASHLGAFKKGMRDQAEPPGTTMRDRIIRNAWISRDTAVDAARMGANMRAYNMITAFANITLQDVDRVFRLLKDDPVGGTLKLGGAITIPSVLLWMANHNDPRYQEIPQWQKDMFWLIMTPDYVIRVPKPWGMGILFGTVPERLLDAFAGEKPDAFKGLAEQFVKQALPEFVPTAVQPMVEQFANRSTFTNRTIIPSTMEKWLPEYQFTPYTTETSKAVGRILGSFPGMRSRIPGQESFLSGPERAVTSPLLMENYIQAWSGGLGMYALQTVDLALRKTGALPDPVLPTKTLADIPIIKAFIVRYPTATTESIQDFHDRYNEKKSYFETWRGMAEQGNIEAMDHIQDMGGDEMFVQLDETEKALAAQQQFVQEVYRLDIPADEKRQLIDETYYGMIETARAGNEMMDEAEKDAAAAREARGR